MVDACVVDWLVGWEVRCYSLYTMREEGSRAIGARRTSWLTKRADRFQGYAGDAAGENCAPATTRVVDGGAYWHPLVGGFDETDIAPLPTFSRETLDPVSVGVLLVEALF
jgi:hypothetical protein